jgi:hypothetical protein
MSTKTAKLRAALVSRGFAPVDHVSQRECLKGLSVQGSDIWIWLDKVGGARYARSPRKGDAIAMSPTTVDLVIAGKPSKLIPGGTP